MRTYIYALLTLLAVQNGHAQENDSTWALIVKNFHSYTNRRPSPGPFLHTDKSIYVSNETIWFTAYLFNDEGPDSLRPCNTLYVLLTDRVHQTPILWDRFLIQNNTAKGALFLGSLPPGEYILVAYTNRYWQTGGNELAYSQPISLRSSKHNDPFQLELQPADAEVQSRDTGYLKYRVTTSYRGLAAGAELKYALYTDGQRWQSARCILNNFGEFLIKYPLKAERVGKGIDLVAQLRRGNDSQNFTVQVTAATMNPLPSSTPAVHAAANYQLDIAESIVKDSIDIKIHAPTTVGNSSEYIVMINDGQHIYLGKEISLENGQGAFRLPAGAIPKGVLRAALLKANGELVTEKGIWLKPNDIKVSIEPHNPHDLFFTNRKRTQWDVSVTDENGKPIADAAFSVSCVLDKRLGRQAPDIRKYFYIDRFLPDSDKLSFLTNYENITQKISDQVTSKWLAEYYKKHPTATDSIHANMPVASGYVRYWGKKPKTAVPLLLLGPRTIIEFTTDANGNFELFPEMLAGPAGSTLLLSVKAKVQDAYKIIMTEQDTMANNRLAAIYYPVREPETDVFTDEEKTRRAVVLQEVIVTAKIKDDYYDVESSILDMDDLCNGWVCSCDHWKCNACQPIHKPIVGYMYFDRNTGRPFIYKGCPPPQIKPFMKVVRAFGQQAPAFPQTDYSKVNSTDPELYSTLYWDYQITTDKNGKASFSFYTNDLNGKFSCVLQGTSAQGVISGREDFIVKSLKWPQDMKEEEVALMSMDTE